MSYRLRLIITIALLIAMTFSIGGAALITASFRITLNTEKEEALRSFESIQNTLFLLHSLDRNSKLEDIQNLMEQIEGQNIGRWQALALGTASESLYQSNPGALGNHKLPRPIQGQCSCLQIGDSFGQGFLVRSAISAGEQELFLTVRFDLSHAYQVRAIQQRLFLISYVAVVFLGTLTAIILSYALTGRLRKLATAVRRISGGDLSTRSALRSRDEFGQLSRDFDAMADKLQENISRLESDIERKENFMGAFAHELKTPMTSIIGFADLLRQGNLDESTRLMAAEYIYSEGHRLERLSFKLLDLLLLQKDQITMKRIWLPEYLSQIDRALSPALREKGIQLICKAEQAHTVLEPDLVKTLVYNLIDNASKAMDGEGIIAVVATALPNGCQFQVADNGRGMEASELTRITEAFYRVDKARSRSQGGAGLGLALCKQIVELHSGNIHFASEPGNGTKVTVALYGKAGKKQ